MHQSAEVLVNSGQDKSYFGCPGIEAYFVKTVAGKYNFQTAFSPLDDDVVRCLIHGHNDLQKLPVLVEIINVLLLVCKDLEDLRCGNE